MRIDEWEWRRSNTEVARPTSEDDLCPICYAHSISAIFKPCSHKSCKTLPPPAGQLPALQVGC
ncbi:hypothetical protein PAMP_016818 [Pampus punctatissimus]